MHRLPTELKKIILRDLCKRDYLQCASVCKAWYTIFISLLFNEITFARKDDLGECIDLIHTSDTFKRALSYVQHVTVENIKFKIVHEKETHSFYDILKQCPHIITLKIPDQKLVMLSLAKSPEGVMSSLTKISFKKDIFFISHKDIYPRMLYRYRQTLRHINIYHVVYSYITKHHNGINTYLSHFPSLTSLFIHYDPKFCTSLSNIMKDCPKLTHLEYRTSGPTELIIDEHAAYTHLHTLRMNLTVFSNTNVAQFKHQFCNLHTLNLTIGGNVEMAKEFTDIVLSMSTLHNIKLFMNVASDAQIIDVVDIVSKHTDFTPSQFNALDAIGYKKYYGIGIDRETTSDGIKNTTIMAEFPGDYRLLLNKYGHTLSQLAIPDRQFVHVDDVMETCPHLQLLKTGSIQYSLDMYSSKVYDGVHTLDFYCLPKNTDIHEQIRFDYIYTRFPQLKTIKIRLDLVTDAEFNKYREYIIRIPGSLVKNLDLDIKYSSTRSILVIKETDEGVEHMWAIRNIRKKLRIDEYRKPTEEVIRKMKRPAVIFKSSSVDHVLFNDNYE